MRDTTIARNYAQALFEAGERLGETDRNAAVLEALAGAIDADDHIRLALESPRVPKTAKVDMVRRALTGRASDAFIRFVSAVVRRGRQGLFGAMSREYQALLDVKFNRVHAGITLAREPAKGLQDELRLRLSAALGKEVIPHFRRDPTVIGGVIVRVGDRVWDGSVRRQLADLRRQMLG